MNETGEITESLERALDRVDGFQAIQRARPPEEHLDAVLCLQEAVGVGDEARALIKERLFDSDGIPTRPAEMLLGVIVGLLAAEYESERRPRDRDGCGGREGRRSGPTEQ
jgi:hypothetical protein